MSKPVFFFWYNDIVKEKGQFDYLTPDTIDEWDDLISAYNTAHASNKQMWWQVNSTGLGGDSFFFIAEPPQDIPMPESSQNELWTVEIPLAIVDYVGLDTAVAPS